MFILGCLCLFAVTAILTGQIKNHAVKFNLVDIPNHRSSHFLPTPRGGGISFSVLFSLSVVISLIWIDDTTIFTVILLFGGLSIALLGLIDDRRGLSARFRLLVQCLVAFVVASGVLDIAFISLQYNVIILSLFFLCIMFYLVWLINLYNFMDGIDGLASLEAITVCLGMSGIYFITNHQALSYYPLLLSAAVAGFFVWNFPWAKIFMGDVGSGFLGFVLGFFSIQAAAVDSILLVSWLIMLGVFIVDATLTLFIRFIKGEAIFSAHKSHAYQQLVIRFGSHLPVTMGIGLINLIVLFPIALMVACRVISWPLGLSIAYGVLGLLYLRYRVAN